MEEIEEKIIKFSIPIYGAIVKVIISKDFIESCKKFKIELQLDSNECNGLAFKNSKDSFEYIMCIKSKKINRWDIIAHEALHITNYILEDRGVGVSLNNDEAQAYLMSYIIYNIQKKLKF